MPVLKKCFCGSWKIERRFMNDERIYVIVPQTVQVMHHYPSILGETPYEVESMPMVHGRLIAQGVHVGRMLGYWMNLHNVDYKEITTIVLAVRNSKELAKVSREIQAVVNSLPFTVPYEEFHDTNSEFYGTEEKVHTITAVGPLSPEVREMLENALGHLELY
jgi:hypothetical protein